MGDERTLKQLAQESLDVQDACNLSGVLHEAFRACCRLRELGEHASSHPIMQLWADKVAHLTHTQELGNAVVMHAYKVVNLIAEGGE